MAFTLLVCATSIAQTFEVGAPDKASPPKPGKKVSRPSTTQDSGMGWGSSIEVAREARAAKTALDRGDYKTGLMYAERATNAAPQNADLWFLVAFAARLAGQYPKSVDAYTRGLRARPSSVEGLSGLAQTYAKMGRSAEAEATLRQVIAANPKSEADLRLAGELMLTSDPKQALTYLERASALRPSARNDLLMARACDRLGDKARAKQLLDRARSTAPHDPEVLRAVASYYRDSGRYDLALSTLRSVPLDNAAYLSELAYTYELAGNRPEAAETYLRAANKAPSQIDIQLNAAQALFNAKQISKAQTLLKRVEGTEPNHYRLHAVRAGIAASTRDNKAAVKEYELAIHALPASIPEGILYPIGLRLNLAQAYRDVGDTEQAQNVANQARAALKGIDITGPLRPEFLRLRAATAVSVDDYQSAERDLQEALKLQPTNTNLLLNYGSLLWKEKKIEESKKTYLQALNVDPTNSSALESMGYLSRELHDPKAARQYFEKLSGLQPNDYVPYLAMGDMYSEARDFSQAEANYDKAYRLAPENPLIIAGAMNAALESHKTPLAKRWLDRANEAQRSNPQVMREHERYLTITGNYTESAKLGYEVIQQLPTDLEAPVYLAYDLLFMNRYNDAMAIAQRFQPILPKDKDLWLIAGYVHAHDGDYRTAVDDFTRALAIDPKMSTGYMNRGYVYNDLRMASNAEKDFRKALALRPDYGEAHLGLAYSLLQLRNAHAALKEAEAAEKILPDVGSLHLAKAEAYRQSSKLADAAAEYERALKFQPNDETTLLSLAEMQYRQRDYQGSAGTLKRAIAIAPNDSLANAQLARSYAMLEERAEASQAIANAEKSGSGDYKVLLTTAEALIAMGQRDQAMERYTRALDLSNADRLHVRLALARLFAQNLRSSDAQQQVAFAFAEARVADPDVITGEDYLDAADILMSVNQFELAERLFARAQAMGADPVMVATGMANASLALGDTRNAQEALASAATGEDHDSNQNYAYLLALGNTYRQAGDNYRALSLFAQANELSPDEAAARNEEFELAEDEGRQLTENVGFGSQFQLQPLFEDENIYQMDARLRGFQNGGVLLPPPRRSIETVADARYHLHFGFFPFISGFVAERNARGTISVPSQLLIEKRNTLDTIFNFGVNPIVRVGNVRLSVTPGLQFTLRRDTLDPFDMNQNLFRQFLYVVSSPIGNWLSFSGSAIREAGPLTEQHLHSRDFSATLDFRLGRPWARTAFLTGYGARDLLFRPAIHEYFTTNIYAGVERKFGESIRFSAAGEYLRAWRVEGNYFAIAQTVRPRFGLDVKINPSWSVSASGSWSQGKGFHSYDNVTGGVLVSYVRELRANRRDGRGSATVSYPLRLSFGFEQQTFYAFPQNTKTSFVPVVRFTLF